MTLILVSMGVMHVIRVIKADSITLTNSSGSHAVSALYQNPHYIQEHYNMGALYIRARNKICKALVPNPKFIKIIGFLIGFE